MQVTFCVDWRTYRKGDVVNWNQPAEIATGKKLADGGILTISDKLLAESTPKAGIEKGQAERAAKDAAKAEKEAAEQEKKDAAAKEAAEVTAAHTVEKTAELEAEAARVQAATPKKRGRPRKNPEG